MLLGSILAATLTCAPIRVDVARQLTEATTLTALDAAAAGLGENEIALRALYRTRRLDMNPTAEEERRYFDALPRSEAEFWCIYKLDQSEPSCGIFERAPRIVRKLGIGHDRIIDLTMWSDGEVAEHAWDAFHWLLENDPQLMAAALKRYPQDRLRGCDETLTAEMSAAEVVRRCSGE